MYVEEKVIEGLKLWLKQYMINWENQKSIEKNINPSKFLEKSLTKLERELAELNEQKNRLHDFLEKGIYSTEVFLERSQILAGRLEKTRQSILGIQEQLIKERNFRNTCVDIIPKVKNVIDIYYKTNDPAKRNSLIKSVLNYATYRKEKHQHNDDFTLVIYPKLPQINPYKETQK